MPGSVLRHRLATRSADEGTLPMPGFTRRLILVLAIGTTVVAVPAAAVAEDQLTRNSGAAVQLHGGFEGGGFGEFSATSSSAGSISVTTERAFRGRRSAVVTSQNSTGFAYSRIQQDVDWRAGDDVWYGAAVYLEPGFNRAQGNGSTDILRWDNWAEHPTNADHGGLALRSDGRLVLIRERMGVSPWTQVLGPYTMPEGRWVWLEVRQRFSATDGQAINEVWIDGRRVGSNTTANYFGRPITRHRVGLVGTPNPQPGRLEMYIDEVTIARNGPVYRASSSSGPAAPTNPFIDVRGTFERDIADLAARGITRGCNPPTNNRYCPGRSMTRGEMATMLVRAFELPPGSVRFRDTGGSVHAANISALASAGITHGCNAPGDRYCPDRPVTRAEMASFLTRVAGLSTARSPFSDVSGTHAGAIGAIQRVGITNGCSPTRYCPDRPVTRAEMAAFLMRTLRHMERAR